MNTIVNHIPENWQPNNELAFNEWFIFKVQAITYNKGL